VVAAVRTFADVAVADGTPLWNLLVTICHASLTI
jgi:hypothetical protein